MHEPDEADDLRVDWRRSALKNAPPVHAVHLRHYVWLKCTNCPADVCELARYDVYPKTMWCKDCCQVGEFVVVGDPALHRDFLDGLPMREQIEAAGIVCNCNSDHPLPERHEITCPIYERFTDIFNAALQLDGRK